MTISPGAFHDLASASISLAHQAGAAIMAIYNSSVEVRYKQDNSPVTDADQTAENIILKGLATLMPGVPIVAEEQAAAGYLPMCGDLFFLVDPLDGTKEFVSRTGEFTVNIALVSGTVPIFGLVYAPALDDCYVTIEPKHAVRFCLVHDQVFRGFEGQKRKVLKGEAPVRTPIALVSRSHQDKEPQAFRALMPNAHIRIMGSSLKFCALARGDADIYARSGPTSEWDTAAGQAILEAAGGVVLTQDNADFVYGKLERNYINPGFVAYRRASRDLITTAQI